jgi:hypothetical protein
MLDHLRNRVKDPRETVAHSLQHASVQILPLEVARTGHGVNRNIPCLPQGSRV